MSNVALKPTQTAVDIKTLLDGLAHAFAPIARQRGISPIIEPSMEPVLVSTSLESILPTFITVWLKVLYLIRPGPGCCGRPDGGLTAGAMRTWLSLSGRKCYSRQGQAESVMVLVDLVQPSAVVKVYNPGCVMSVANAE
jgi:hypothetical protein